MRGPRHFGHCPPGQCPKRHTPPASRRRRRPATTRTSPSPAARSPPPGAAARSADPFRSRHGKELVSGLRPGTKTPTGVPGHRADGAAPRRSARCAEVAPAGDRPYPRKICRGRTHVQSSRPGTLPPALTKASQSYWSPWKRTGRCRTSTPTTIIGPRSAPSPSPSPVHRPASRGSAPGNGTCWAFPATRRSAHFPRTPKRTANTTPAARNFLNTSAPAFPRARTPRFRFRPATRPLSRNRSPCSPPVPPVAPLTSTPPRRRTGTRTTPSYLRRAGALPPTCPPPRPTAPARDRVPPPAPSHPVRREVGSTRP